MIKRFQIENIGELDSGRIAKLINKSLDAAIMDCKNRPGLDQDRSVSIKLSVTPVLNDQLLCEEVEIEVESGAKLPKDRSKTMSMGVRSRRGPDGKNQTVLVFNDASPDNIKQGTLDQAVTGSIDPETGEVDDDNE